MYAHWRARCSWWDTPFAIPDAAGATLSTVDDLARWNAALESGRVIGRGLLRDSRQRVRTADGATGGYGMGWMLSSFGPHEVQWHGGDIAGYPSMMLRIPQDRLLVIVLSNNESAKERPMFVALRLAELALGEDWSKRPEVTTAQLQRLAGRYREPSGLAYRIEARDGRLFADDGGDRAPVELKPVSASEYEGHRGLRFRFALRGARPAEALVLRPIMGREQTLRRVPATEVESAGTLH